MFKSVQVHTFQH